MNRSVIAGLLREELGFDGTVCTDWSLITDKSFVAAPFEARPGRFESMFHAGSLAFPARERDRLLAVCAAVPTVVDLHLDRPAVVPELAGATAALLVNYGASDDALVDVLTGAPQARGRLPFDPPSSEEAVRASRSDVPFDTADPLFRFVDGLQA